MSGKYKNLYPVSIGSGWEAVVEVTRNSSGSFVITDLHIAATTKEAEEAGLTVQILRSVKFKELIDSALEDEEYVELSLMQESDYDWVNDKKNLWWNDIRQEWKNKGPNGFDQDLYAKTSFFYILETRLNPASPLVSLSEKLGIDRGLLAKRIDKARQLDILSRPSDSGPSHQGKAAGMLTRKGRELLGLTIKGWK